MLYSNHDQRKQNKGENIMENILTTDFGYCDWSLSSDIEFDEEGVETESCEYAHIENLHVNVGERGKGKGRELLEAAIKQIESVYPDLEIKIVPEPKDSNIEICRLANFYESLGITVVSV